MVIWSSGLVLVRAVIMMMDILIPTRIIMTEGCFKYNMPSTVFAVGINCNDFLNVM
jgi:hypothetical protein